MEQNQVRRNFRQQMMLATGAMQPPMKRCFKFELIDMPVIKPNYLGDIMNALKAMDSELRIYYDAATAVSTSKPGWHVYRCFGGVGAHEQLHHVFGIMERMSETDEKGNWTLIQWPDGKPCLPSMAVVEEYKKRWHRHTHPHLYKTIDQMDEEAKKAVRKEKMEALGGDGDGPKADWDTFRKTPGLARKTRNKQRREENRTPATQVSVPVDVSTINIEK